MDEYFYKNRYIFIYRRTIYIFKQIIRPRTNNLNPFKNTGECGGSPKLISKINMKFLKETLSIHQAPTVPVLTSPARL